MSRPDIESFLIDAENEEKFAFHGLKEQQVRQILESRYILIPNKKNARGEYLVIGEDFGGICITVPIEGTHETTIWRPITAWQCSQRDFTILNHRR